MNKEIYDITDLYEAVKINDELKEENHNLCKELERYKNIIDDIDKYIHYWNIRNIDEKTMLILNDILLIKNGMSDEVIRLKELKGSDN